MLEKGLRFFLSGTKPAENVKKNTEENVKKKVEEKKVEECLKKV